MNFTEMVWQNSLEHISGNNSFDVLRQVHRSVTCKLSNEHFEANNIYNIDIFPRSLYSAKFPIIQNKQQFEVCRPRMLKQIVAKLFGGLSITNLISAFSQISACGLSGQKRKPQAESDFVNILRYSDKILVDDPGEKKCSVGDVRLFFSGFEILCVFFFGRKFMFFKTVNFFNAVIRVVFTPWYPNNTVYSVSGHLNQTSSKSLKTPSGRKNTPGEKIPFGLKYQPEQFRAEKTACGRPRYGAMAKGNPFPKADL